MLRHLTVRPTRLTMLCLALLALGASLIASPALAMPAAALIAGPYTVNTTNDTHCVGFVAQDAPGCTSVTDSGGNISLRSALEAANTLGGSTQINVPAGTYNLSLGDLVAGTQANTTIYIHGQGTPATTTIHQTGAGRMVIVQNYKVDSNVVLQMDNITITGGSENENDPDGFGGNGGAILGGGGSGIVGVAMTFTNMVFSGNYCSPVADAACSGGAISMTGGGNLTVSNSTFTGNIAAKNSGFGAGGAIYFDNNANGGNVSITNSIFTNNTAQGNSTTGGQGGAIRLAGGAGSTYTVSTNLFTGNAANGTAAAGAHGGAIYLSLGSLTASFNRIVGNTNADSSGLYVANNSGSIGTATNNWWGCNGGPGGGVGCDTALLGTPNQGGSMTVSPWIVLTNTASPNPVQVNQTSTLTADFLHNSNGGSLTAGQVSLLIGLPVSWGSAVRGLLSGQQTSIQSNGTATATFTASAAGAGSATATVDNGAAVGSITINKANTTTTITAQSTNTTVTGQGYLVSFSVSSSTGTTPTAPTGNVTVSDGTDSCIGAIDNTFAGSCTLTSSTAGAKTITATYNSDAGDLNFNVSTSTGVSHTVNKADTTTTIISESVNPSVVGQTVTVKYSVSVNAPGSGTPTGNVTVTDGTLTCTALVSDGKCDLTFTSAGIHTLSASYAGDSNYNASGNSATVSQQVNPADTTTTITSSSLNPSDVGQLVTFNYTVTANSPGAGTPTGSVTVSDGTDHCTALVSDGKCSLTFTTSGIQSMTASYAGDGNFNGSTSAPFSQTVLSAAPAITSADHTTFTVGTPGSFMVTTTGSPAPSITESGGLPSGVTFTDNGDGTATLAGTPNAGTAGTYSLLITAHNGVGSDATQSFTLAVNQAPAITSANNAAFTEGQAGAFTVTTTGSPVSTITESGALPSGVTFTDNHDGTASLAGTPNASTAGTYSLVITASNGVGSDATQNFTLTVNHSLAITSADNTTFVVGTAGSFTVTTQGSPVPDITESGSLPSGTTFTDNHDGTATLAGTPAAGTGGIYSLVITAHNGAGPDAKQNFTLTVNQAPAITSADNTTFVEGQAGSFTVISTGFPTGATLSESGSLPSGITFTDNHDGTGTLAGTPAAGTAGTYPITFGASNGVTPNAQQTFTLTILPSAVQVTIQTSPAGLAFSVDGTSYTSSQTLTWSAGSTHTLATTSPQAAGPGAQYAFNNWSDGGGISHVVNTPNTATTYTASFDTQYQLTTSVSPSVAGTVSPASGTFYAANAVVSLTATANPGFTFLNWTGNVANASSASTSITMSGPESVTANFSAPTSLLYNGGQIVTIGNSFKPAALLSSPVSSCVGSQAISFSLDRNPTNGSPGSFPLGSATTGSNGQATMGTAVNTSGWLEGIYTVTSTFAGTTNCNPSSYDATLAVASAGDSASGGGWYTLSGSGRINFGFTVSKTVNTCTSNCAYQGQLLLINTGKWRLKGTLNTYVKTSTGTGAAGGTGDLYWWNTSLNGGLGDWALAAPGVSFSTNFFDSGKTGKQSTDSFTINIQYTPVPPRPGNLPNSNQLQLLKGGDIRVK